MAVFALRGAAGWTCRYRLPGEKYTHFDKKPDGIEVVKVADIPALVRALFK